MTFNAPAPPGFRGLHPDLPIQTYRRHLPHWRQEGATYFATFHCADSIPQTHRDALKRWRLLWEKENPEPRSEKQWIQLAREIHSRTDAYLDEGNGECVLGDPANARCVSTSLLHFQDVRYFLSCFVVMPNHIHLAIRPSAGYRLETLLGDMKGFLSHTINERLGRTGQLWEPESYDRVVRNEEHLWNVVQYIGRNPGKAGLPVEKWHRWLHPDWVKAGWGFHDGP